MRITNRDCLIVVDMQNDFFDGGVLPVKGSNDIVSHVNDLMKIFNKNSRVIASGDCHHEHSQHFDTWPSHCVEGTFGSFLHSDLNTNNINDIVYKGTGTKDNGYSVFDDDVNVSEYLKLKQIVRLFVCGLALDYCVLETCLDGLINGFEVYLIMDCTKAIDSDAGNEAIEQILDEGGCIISSRAFNIID